MKILKFVRFAELGLTYRLINAFHAKKAVKVVATVHFVSIVYTVTIYHKGFVRVVA